MLPRQRRRCGTTDDYTCLVYVVLTLMTGIEALKTQVCIA